jgi:DNA-binding response OmpR family regulator
MSLLLIEPDKLLANVFTTELKKHNFKVWHFFDAQTAIEYMDTNLPDMIIMELQLAPISGVSFLYELRSYEDFCSIPIVIYSSIPKESFKLTDKDWLELGVVKYFYKSKISIQKVASFALGYFK